MPLRYFYLDLYDKGPSINDVTQVGGVGMYFCDTLYEKLRDVIYECPLSNLNSLLL